MNAEETERIDLGMLVTCHGNTTVYMSDDVNVEDGIYDAPDQTVMLVLEKSIVHTILEAPVVLVKVVCGNVVGWVNSDWLFEV